MFIHVGAAAVNFRGPQYFPSHGKTIPLIRWATRFLTIHDQLPETMWQVILSTLVAGQALPFVPKVCRSKYGRIDFPWEIKYLMILRTPKISILR